MDTKKVETRKIETRELSDDQLDAVSAGDLKIGVGVCTNEPTVKPQGEALKGFQQLLQELP